MFTNTNAYLDRDETAWHTLIHVHNNIYEYINTI